MDRPTSSSARLDGQELTELSEKELAALRLERIWRVLQQPHLMRALNLLDNIVLPGFLTARKPRAEIVRRGREFMERMGIDDLADSAVSQVSGGRLQRAGLGGLGARISDNISAMAEDTLDLSILPLDTPDDDPTWAGFVAQSQLGFLEPETTEKQVEAFRQFSRADHSRLRVVHDPASALPHQPVATFASFDKAYHVGGGRTVPANFISEVTVRSSHRRRGLLRRLMETDLAQTNERGAAIAMLTASEATIYGRFGFAPVNRRAVVEINARRFALRQPAGGRIEFVGRERGTEVFDAITTRQRTRRGGFTRPAAHQPEFTGAVDYETGESDRAVRLVVHYPPGDEAGAAVEPDGIASFKAVPNSAPATIRVRLEAVTPQAEVALLAFLVQIDLVERLRIELPVDHPLPWALTDPRCLHTVKVDDHFWVRVLDIETLLGERAWMSDGQLTLAVRDSLGYCEGTWRIEVEGGRAQVTQTASAEQASVDVATLAQLACGGIAPAQLVAVGLVTGTEEAQHAVARLFTTRDLLADPWGF